MQIDDDHGRPNGTNRPVALATHVRGVRHQVMRMADTLSWLERMFAMVGRRHDDHRAMPNLLREFGLVDDETSRVLAEVNRLIMTRRASRPAPDATPARGQVKQAPPGESEVVPTAVPEDDLADAGE